MKKQQGFTLIELVVVIVILGILAVTAAPKFINLQADARTGTLQAIKASMQTASTIIHSKSLIAGNETLIKTATPTPIVVVNGVNTKIGFGYPLADYSTADTTNPGTWADLLEIDAADFLMVERVDVDTKTKFVVYPADSTAPSEPIVATDHCYVTYEEATSSTLPVYTVVDCI
jgi:MSHA pilin protein MshA